jgi:hypothetical protein
MGAECNDARIAATELLANSNACAGDSGSPAFDADGDCLFPLGTVG